jgi:hypothetical protein
LPTVASGAASTRAFPVLIARCLLGHLPAELTATCQFADKKLVGYVPSQANGLTREALEKNREKL